MFKVTFLGHQGWILRAGTTTLLVDPLLTKQFTAPPYSHASVFPPRVIEHEKFPPVSAVFVTHEHDDHFQVVSLNRLDRKIPLLLSARMSMASETAVRHMGFENVR